MCFIIIIIIIALYCVVVFGYIDEYSGDMSLVLPICFEKIHSQTMLETILVSPTKFFLSILSWDTNQSHP
jgi:hypothetical protein